MTLDTPDAPPPPKPGRRFKITVIQILIIVAVVGGMAAISTPKFVAARERAFTRSCYANQKTIVGAIEMYNLDRKAHVTALDAAMYAALKSGGYLHAVPQDPGLGAGTSGDYRLVKSGDGIRCQVHGAIQDEATPAAR